MGGGTVTAHTLSFARGAIPTAIDCGDLTLNSVQPQVAACPAPTRTPQISTRRPRALWSALHNWPIAAGRLIVAGRRDRLCATRLHSRVCVREYSDDR
jgi:hypothetical protein